MVKRKNKTRVLKQDIEQILSEELGTGGGFDCGRKRFNIDLFPASKQYLSKRLLNLLRKYMTSSNDGYNICLYRNHKEKIDNNYRLGDIYEIIDIEPFEQGEIIFQKRYNLMKKLKKQQNENCKK